MEEKFILFSPEWIHEAIKTVQGARSKDMEFRKLTSGYSLSLAYIITDLPPKLRDLYGNDQITLFIRLDKGMVRDFKVLTEKPIEKTDFTITSTYPIAKQIFLGQLSIAAAFIDRQIKVEPLDVMYRKPRFTAKSIIVANKIVKLCQQIPTEYA
ncbi:MAG: hypothetical protein LZ167_01260 [Thaumarchaeota archaeon]|jgi:putative sterol carrier protein|nr:hypothetical protein [Candidatus Geocrenenecus arthurdayi]MCL7396034.1 hypothetical protein [Candidatus Geocrenenecus arthurdayi]